MGQTYYQKEHKVGPLVNLEGIPLGYYMYEVSFSPCKGRASRSDSN